MVLERPRFKKNRFIYLAESFQQFEILHISCAHLDHIDIFEHG